MALGLFTAWALWARPRLEDWAAPRLESALSRALGREAHVASIKIHPLLLWARAENLRLGPAEAPLFRCRRWTVHALLSRDPSPWAFFFFSLGRSHVEDPIIALPAREGPLILRPGWWRSLPLHRLSWSGGTLDVPLGQGRPPLHLRWNRGDVGLSPRGVTLRAEGDGDPGPWRIEVTAADNRRLPPRLAGRVRLTMEEADLERFNAWIPAGWGSLSGRAGLTVSFAVKDFTPQGLLEPENEIAAVPEGTLEFRSARWRPASALPRDWGIPLNGRIDYKEGRVRVKALTLFQGLVLSGTADRLSSGGAGLSMSLQAADVELENLRRCGWPLLRAVPPSGRVSGEFLLKGTTGAPKISWRGEAVNLGYPGAVLPPLTVVGEWENRHFDMTANASKGALHAQSDAPSIAAPGSTPVWSLRVDDFSLEEIGRVNNWSHLGGLVNGRFSLERVPGQAVPRVQGLVRIDGFQWGIHRETSPVEGRLSLDGDGCQLNGSRGEFRLTVDRDGDRWRMGDLAYRAGDLRVWGRGLLRDEAGRLSVEGGVERVPVADLLPLGSRFPEASGTASFSGRLTGTWQDPIFTGRLLVNDLRWRPGGIPHRGEADLRGARDGLTLHRWTWDDHVTGEGAWFFNRGWRFKVDVRPTALDRLLDFQNGSLPAGGTVGGQVSLSAGEQAGWEGWARLEWLEGHWGGLAVSSAQAVALFRGDAIELSECRWGQSGGRMTARGSVVRYRESGGGRPLGWRGSFDAATESFGVGAAVLSGSWTVRGAWTHSPQMARWTVESRSVRLGSLDAGPLFTEGHWRPEEWGVDAFRCFRGVSAHWSVNGTTQTWDGAWRAEGVDLDSLWPGKPVWRAGLFEGAGVLSGQGARPRVEGSVSVLGAAWRGLGATIAGNFRWADAVFTVPTLSLSFVDGGTVSLQGTVGSSGENASPGGSARWTARADGVRLDNLLRSFGAGAEWRAVLSGEAEGSGTWNDFRAAGRLAGDGVDGRGGTWKALSRVSFSSRTFTIEEAGVQTVEGQWRLEPGGQVSRRQGGWDVDVVHQLRNIRLGPLQFFGALRVAGRVEPGHWTAQLTAQPLWVNQRLYEQSLTRVAWRPGELRFSGVPGDPTSLEGVVRLDRWPQMGFENLVLRQRGEPRLTLAGEIGPRLWDFTLDARDLSAETLLSLADADWPVTGSCRVLLRGLGSPEAPDVSGEVRGRDGRVGVLPYDELQADAHWAGAAVDIKKIRLVRRNGYLLTGEGRFPLRPEESPEPMSLTLRLTNGKLQLLPEIWPVCRWAKGSFDGWLTLGRGADGRTEASGEWELRDGRMAARAYATDVKNLQARLVFEGDRVRVERATARLKRGDVDLSGSMALSGVSPAEYDLRFRTLGKHGAYVEVPQLSVGPGPLLGRLGAVSEKFRDVSRGEPIFDLRLTGPHGAHRLSGDVFLERTQFTFPPFEKSGLKGPRWWRELWRLMEWDVLFHAGRSTWYGNEYITAELDGNLRLAGHRGDWRASGKLESRDGSIRYLGQSFRLTRGVFEMVTDTRPGVGYGTSVPFVSGTAEKTVTNLDARGFAVDDTVTMVVDRAPLGKIEPRFVSRNNPDMKTERVAMRALGLSGDKQITPAERDQLLRAGLVQLVGNSATPMAQRLANKFGIDMISAIYEPPETQETPSGLPSPGPKTSDKPRELVTYLRGAGASARVKVNDRLFGFYKVKWDEAQNQFYFRDEIELVYRVAGSLHARASTELDSEQLLGQPPERRVALENQWRFGLPRRRKKRAEDMR